MVRDPLAATSQSIERSEHQNPMAPVDRSQSYYGPQLRAIDAEKDAFVLKQTINWEQTTGQKPTNTFYIPQ